jgi:hypothetical protein
LLINFQATTNLRVTIVVISSVSEGSPEFSRESSFVKVKILRFITSNNFFTSKFAGQIITNF